MKRLLAILILTAACTFSAAAAPKKPATKPDAVKPPQGPTDFTGRYERVGDAKTVFLLHVRQTGERAEIDFSAGRADGSGAAPDGTGSGKLNEKDELAFTFQDSFGNKGTGLLAKTKTGFQLTLNAETVAEPRAVKFYGVIVLKRGPDREN